MNLYHPLIICINGVKGKTSANENGTTRTKRKATNEGAPQQKKNPDNEGGDNVIQYNEVANVLLCNYDDDLIRLYRIIKLLHEPGNLEWLSRPLTCRNIFEAKPDEKDEIEVTIDKDVKYVYKTVKNRKTVKAEDVDGFKNRIGAIYDATFGNYGVMKFIQLQRYHNKTENGMINELINTINKMKTMTNCQKIIKGIKYLKLIDENNIKQLNDDSYVWSGFIGISTKTRLKGGSIKPSLTMFLIIVLTIILVIILVIITKKDDEQEDLFFLT